MGVNMDVVTTLITCFFIPLVGVLVFIVKSIKEYHEARQGLDSIRSTMKELGGNGFIANFGSNIPTQPSVPKMPKTKHPKLTNCKNCGAVLHGNKCEFCDTEYDW